MSDIKKILVPIDGSAASRKAAERAVSIAKKNDSEITFVTVAAVPDLYRYGDMRFRVEKSYGDIVNNAKELETKMIDKFLDELNIEGINFEKIVVVGEPYEEILKIANESIYDYIVMGRRGYSKITRFFIGSVTQRVISEAPCPVIVVKE